MADLSLYMMAETIFINPNRTNTVVGFYAVSDLHELYGGIAKKGNNIDLYELFDPILTYAEENNIKSIKINLEAEDYFEKLKPLLANGKPEALLESLKNRRGVPEWAIKLVSRICDTKVKFKPVKKITNKELTGVLKADGSVDLVNNRSRISDKDESFLEQYDVGVDPKVNVTKPLMLPDSVIFDFNQGENVYRFGNTDMTHTKAKKDQLHSSERQDKSYVYYNGTPTRLRKMGSYNVEERYCVAILNSPIEFLDKVSAHQRKVSSQMYSVCPMTVMRLDAIYSKKVAADIEKGEFGNFGYTTNGSMYQILGKRADLTWVANPAPLTFKIRRSMSFNETELRKFMENKELLTYTDVTDIFYTKDDKDKTIINPALSKDANSVVLENVRLPEGNKPAKIKSLYRMDMPTYQHFKRMARINPEVYIVTRMLDDHIVSYSFIIKTDEGWMHYAAEYAAKHTLRSMSKRNRKA